MQTPGRYLSMNFQLLKSKFTKLIKGTNAKLSFEQKLGLGSAVAVVGSLLAVSSPTTLISISTLYIPLNEWYAKKISEQVAATAGIFLEYESAVVPQWTQGTLRLENVSIKYNMETWMEYLKYKGMNIDHVDPNWAYWDLSVKSIDVTLSLKRWFEGKGFIEKANINGVRGTLDRSHIVWESDWKPIRRKPVYGDFELEGLEIGDLMITVKNPNFRPFHLSIFSAQLPLFRKQWALYDFMCASPMVGVIDGVLFSTHKPQRSDLVLDDESKGPWAKMINLKMNGLSIEHLVQQVTSGPLSWLTQGKFDLEVSVLIPQILPYEDILQLVRSEINSISSSALGKIEEIVSNHPEREAVRQVALRKAIRNYGTRHPQELADPKKKEKEVSLYPPSDGRPSVYMFWNMKMSDLKAQVPSSTPELSYMSSALVRPIVSYLNAHRTSVEVSFDSKMDLVRIII